MFARQLEYLIALARTRHFARAAKDCQVSQPALSGAIRSLEEELGVPLVLRRRNFDGFTPDGERLLLWARRILADWEGFRQEASTSRSQLTGKLRIGVIPTADAILPLITEPMRAATPMVTHHIVSLSSEEILRQLHSFELDLGVSYVEEPRHEAFRGLPLYRERSLLIVACTSPLASNTRMTWAQAAEQPLCLLTPNMQNRRIVDAAFRRAGETPNVVVETDSILALLTYVSSGLCSVVPQTLCRHYTHQGDVHAIELEPALDRPVELIVLARDPLTPLVAKAWQIASHLKLWELVGSADKPELSPHPPIRLAQRRRSR